MVGLVSFVFVLTFLVGCAILLEGGMAEPQDVGFRVRKLECLLLVPRL